MDTRSIRDSFLAHFKERDHHLVPSSSLVPNDPTLLFTNAGMIQFKPHFQGEQTPPFNRAMSIQKCMRAGGKHNDLEEVGRTSRHLTFFEMLGNFSFGDYFKLEACAWGWELVTDKWGMDPERLWVSVYETDDDAFAIWRDEVGVPPERILRLGKDDNYWSMGVAGPCGPCSEILFDRGEDYGEASPRGPLDNDERYLEFWNLVFMQNEFDSALREVGELPTKNIDTGAGLERIAMLLQEKRSVLETDILLGMIDAAAEVVGKPYGLDEETDFGLRVLADHGRAMTFMIADGVLPANEERGYVLRRVVRRAIRHARLLGHEGGIVEKLIDRCVKTMGDFYPEIVGRKDFINEVAVREEEGFSETLRQGLSLLDVEIARTKQAAGDALAGDVVFRLHDTYGFPVDLTREIAGEEGLLVDERNFEELMDAQRRRARAARRTGAGGGEASGLAALAEEHGPTEFMGYEHLAGVGRVLGIAGPSEIAPAAVAGDEVDVVLDSTVFYAEGGGQVGDRGRLVGPSGEADVVDTRRIAPGVTGHRVRVTAGEIKVGDELQESVDTAFRTGCERSHTATHILHWTLRDRLGEHATQAGSLVEPGRLRFDFNHYDAFDAALTADISAELQERVLADDAVLAYETSFDYARSQGVMAIFGEKYGDFVRVVEVGEYSKELCGGTHVPHTSQIGVAVLTSESSVGANLRRVEALVGRDGIRYLSARAEALERAATLLRSKPDEVEARIERLLATQKEMERRVAAIERSAASAEAEALAKDATPVADARLVVARRDRGVDAPRALAQATKSARGSGIVVLGAATDDRANLVAAVSKDLLGRGVSARDLIQPGARLLGGGGGGRPELAISGGPRAAELDAAMASARRAAEEALGA
ncbi:alanine--tRNA ligase [soil metagenome]